MKRATIILADDHPHVAEQIRHLLDDAFEVVAVVGHGEALVKAAARLRPDVVVTDISMTGVPGCAWSSLPCMTIPRWRARPWPSGVVTC